MKFMDVLRQARCRKKISLRQLAKLSGISVGSISLYELGKIEPTLRAANQLCKVLGTSITVGEGTDYTPVREFKKGGRKDASA